MPGWCKSAGECVLPRVEHSAWWMRLTSVSLPTRPPPASSYVKPKQESEDNIVFTRYLPTHPQRMARAKRAAAQAEASTGRSTGCHSRNQPTGSDDPSWGHLDVAYIQLRIAAGTSHHWLLLSGSQDPRPDHGFHGRPCPSD